MDRPKDPVDVHMKCADCGAGWNPDRTVAVGTGGPTCAVCGGHEIGGTFWVGPLSSLDRYILDGEPPLEPSGQPEDSPE